MIMKAESGSLILRLLHGIQRGGRGQVVELGGLMAIVKAPVDWLLVRSAFHQKTIPRLFSVLHSPDKSEVLCQLEFAGIQMIMILHYTVACYSI
jgi:hypothetical protein